MLKRRISCFRILSSQSSTHLSSNKCKIRFCKSKFTAQKSCLTPVPWKSTWDPRQQPWFLLRCRRFRSSWGQKIPLQVDDLRKIRTRLRQPAWGVQDNCVHGGLASGVVCLKQFPLCIRLAANIQINKITGCKSSVKYRCGANEMIIAMGQYWRLKRQEHRCSCSVYGEGTWWALQTRSRDCDSRNSETTSAPKAYETPLSLGWYPEDCDFGSDHRMSHIIPVSPTSTGRCIVRICSSDLRSGERPTTGKFG